MKKQIFLVMIVISSTFFNYAHANSNGTALSITGLYLGGPSDYFDVENGGVTAIVGARFLSFDFDRSFNYFATAAVSVDLFLSKGDIEEALDVESIDDRVLFEENVFSGFIFSGGITYNLKALDNIVLYAGPEVLLGESIITLPDNTFLKISDPRIGLVGGVLLGFKQFFVSADYSTTTESIRFALGYGF